MNDKQREYMMGHKLKGKTYAAGLLTDEKLVEAYQEVEAKLSVL